MVVKASVTFLTANSDAVLVTSTNTILISMEGNPNYAMPTPTVVAIRAALDAFIAAITAAADGGKQLTYAKKMARAVLVALLRQLAAYVQMAADGDMTKLLSSGFPVQKPNRSKAVVPATPNAPKVKQGLSGQAKVSVNAVVGAFIYNWQVALADAPETILFRAQSTGSRTTFGGLTPGKEYLFQANAVGTAGPSDFSNPGSRMII